MDVARISMITPKTIDWRKLTAKDIIKYDSEGMTVPSEYLSWAKSFHVDLEKNDTDDTTYEMAVSKPLVSQKVPKPADSEARRDSSTKTEKDKMQTTVKENTGATASPETAPEDTKQTQETEETNEQTNSTANTEEDANLTAEEKKKKLEDDGEGTIAIGRIFMTDSEAKAAESDSSANTINTIGQNSDNAIATLDSYMNDLLAQAGDIQSKINTLKNKNGKNQSNFAKIASLQQELKSLGTSGQNVALGYDTDLNMYQPTIENGATIGLDAQDYGNTTIELGNDIKRYIYTAGLGRIIEKAGKNAVDSGQNTQGISTQVADQNSANIRVVQQHQASIKDKTGVSAEEVAGDNKNSTQNENSNTSKRDVYAKTNTDPTKTAEQQNKKSDTLSGKQETTAQKIAKDKDNTSDATKTDVEKKEQKIASGNLDEILKRKLRKGEVEQT